MSRMHSITTLILVLIVGAGTWYGTREMTRNQFRAQIAEQERDRVVAELQRYHRMLGRLQGETPDGEVTAGLPTLLPDGAMRALETRMRVLANNLDNTDTIGFKRSQVVFEDLPSPIHGKAGIDDMHDHPEGIQATQHTRISRTQLDFKPGTLRHTNRPLDLAIEGEGFFQVRGRSEGKEIIAYTRAGNFIRNADGNLVLGNREESLLQPPIKIPEDVATEAVVVDRDGKVLVRLPGSSELTHIGQIELARVIRPEKMCALGKNLFIATDASGSPITGIPMQEELGAIVTGMLEGSNVEPAQESIELLIAQKAYGMRDTLPPLSRKR